MRNRFLFVVFWCFTLNSINAACADDITFPYDNSLKVFSHWMMSCYNLNECMALGYPNKGDDGVGQTWDVIAKWQKGSDIMTFSVPDFSEGDKTALSVNLCNGSGKCHTVDAKENLQITARGEPYIGDEKILQFILNVNDLTEDSYLIPARTDDSPIPFKELLQNRNSIPINHLPQLDGKENIYKWQSHDGHIAVKDIKRLYPEYAGGGWQDGWDNRFESYADNYIVTYENGDKFMFLPYNEQANTIIAKYNGKTYEDFNVLDKTAFNITGGAIAEGSTFGIVKWDNKSKKIFRVSNLPLHSWQYCSLAYDMAYNGKKFIIETIRYMPLCMNIPIEDWPIVYQRPQ